MEEAGPGERRPPTPFCDMMIGDLGEGEVCTEGADRGVGLICAAGYLDKCNDSSCCVPYCNLQDPTECDPGDECWPHHNENSPQGNYLGVCGSP